MEEITVQEFKQKIDAGGKVFLLDVREPFEQYQSKIDYENSELIPLGQLSEKLGELESRREEEIVCMCRSGGRSEKACKLLEEHGFEKVKNLKGGINRWAREIDTSLPVY
ncbi:MAG: rhodanese-like domain-containing protein [Balneolaceae bacterium]|nr:rhodanese-like domain-containing protein [Balneolaceae bacterium]